jgi:hypothetical protein
MIGWHANSRDEGMPLLLGSGPAYLFYYTQRAGCSTSVVFLVASLGTQPHSGRSFQIRQVTLIDVLTTGKTVASLTENSSNKTWNDYMGYQL